jgi:DUF4097 and DUF4098 domain-containing protein YvlB
MKLEGVIYLAAATLCLGATLLPGQTRTTTRNHNLSINTRGDAEKCADLQVTSDGQVAQSTDSFSFRRSEAPVLEMNGMDRGSIRVLGWNNADFSVEACKIAVAEDRAAADQTLRSIAVSRTAGRISSTGPASEAVQWMVYFIVHAPKDASLDLETRNGPISVRDITGNVKVRAVNGPIGLDNVGGTVDAHTQNGPISFSGSGGDVHLNAHNGPIAVKLAGEMWNGTQLDARTVNGPVAFTAPENFHSGVRIETSAHSPISCRLGACQNAWTDARSDQHVLQLNGSSSAVRLSTTNGPVSIGGPEASKKRFM